MHICQVLFLALCVGYLTAKKPDCSSSKVKSESSKALADRRVEMDGVGTCSEVAASGNKAGLCAMNDVKVRCPCTCDEDDDEDDEEKTTTTSSTTTTSGPALGDQADEENPVEEGEDPAEEECFHGDEMVRTPSGYVMLKDIAGQREVLVEAVNAENKLIYSPVKLWMHIAHAQEATFLEFQTASNHSISMTMEHLAHIVPCSGPFQKDTVPAMDVTVGQCMIVNSDGVLSASKITSIVPKQKTGYFSPITSQGNIVVNGVAASCYTDTKHEWIAHRVYSILIWFTDRLPSIFGDSLFGQTYPVGQDIPVAWIFKGLEYLSFYTSVHQ